MTKKKKFIAKHTPDAEVNEKCACGCGCDKENCTCCCQCQGCKIAMVGATALALILSIAACVTSCHCSQEPDAAVVTSRNIDRQIEAWVKTHPQVIVEAVEGDSAPAAVDPKAVVAKIVADKTNYSLGNEKGKFVIIEFFDYNCGWCQKTNGEMKAALAKPEAKNIRWIPIDTPIFGASSTTIAQYVLAAGKQGKYAVLHDAVATGNPKLNEARKKVGEAVKEFMTKNNITDGRDSKVQAYAEKVSVEAYSKAMEEIAKGLKLDVGALKKAAHGSEIKQKLEANNEYRRALGIQGVPMLIVNGRVNPGALFGEALDKVVAESAK